MNLTNIGITPVHIAFDEVCRKASERGIRVTGSELVGLIPLKAMIDAGKYFLAKQQRSLGVDNDELIKIAIKSLGLDELKPFNPKEKIIEYVLESSESKKKLIHLTAAGLANETASESPAPGGGSISAYVGALGVSLATMVANLSAHKRGWDERWEEFSQWAEKGQQIKDYLLYLVDEDTRAFNLIMEALDMPKKTEEEKENRTKAIEDASIYAIEVPFKVMQTALDSMEIIQAMAEIGNPNSVSDAGVGALCARSAIMGAYLNVKINAASVSNKEKVAVFLTDGEEVERKALELEAIIIRKVNETIASMSR
jgi:glutamate formiminotransferase/formiminotetrahydrofolate cyclodeaminase